MRFQSDDGLVIHNVAEAKMFRIARQTKSQDFWPFPYAAIGFFPATNRLFPDCGLGRKFAILQKSFFSQQQQFSIKSNDKNQEIA